MLDSVIFPGVLPGNQSSYVREEVCYFIQTLLVYCILLQVWLYTSWCIYFCIHLWNCPLALTKHYWCHFWNAVDIHNLGSHELKTKHFFNSTVVGTILNHHYCLWVELVIFSLHNLAQNLIQQYPEDADFLCRFSFHLYICYSNDVLHGRVVHKEGQCFVADTSWMWTIKVCFLTLQWILQALLDPFQLLSVPFANCF